MHLSAPACIPSPLRPRVLAIHYQVGRYHYGVDLPAPPGASIVAIVPGKWHRDRPRDSRLF
jgi:murein DD-endopeptidase MepM/ murein hydrolase activator NlpD